MMKDKIIEIQDYWLRVLFGSTIDAHKRVTFCNQSADEIMETITGSYGMLLGDEWQAQIAKRMIEEYYDKTGGHDTVYLKYFKDWLDKEGE